MGFSVKTHKLSLDISNSGDNKCFLEKFLLSWIADAEKYSGEALEYYSADSQYFSKGITDIKDIIDHNEFEIKIDKNGNNAKIEYKVVTTDGPIINFMGFNIDLESGYIVFGRYKSKEFVALANFYDFLDRYNVTTEKPIMSHFIERFKIADINLEQLVDNLNKASGGFDYNKSVTGSYLNQKINENIKTIGTLTENSLLYYFKFISKVIGRLNSTASFYMDYANLDADYMYILENRASTVGATIVPLLNGIIESKPYFRDLNIIYHKIDDSLMDIDRGKRKEEHVRRDLESNLLAISTGLVTSMGDFSNSLSDKSGEEVIKSDFSNMNKSTAIVLNMYDILDSNEDHDVLNEMDDLIFTSESNVKINRLRKVIEKTGIKNYISGASLAHVSKRVKLTDEDRDFKKLVNNMTANAYRADSIMSEFIPVQTVVKGFKKSVVFYKGVLKHIKNVAE